MHIRAFQEQDRKITTTTALRMKTLQTRTLYLNFAVGVKGKLLTSLLRMAVVSFQQRSSSLRTR
eukprot:18444-Eustigmatos_ZCMA.PRE.1